MLGSAALIQRGSSDNASPESNRYVRMSCSGMGMSGYGDRMTMTAVGLLEQRQEDEDEVAR